jgi:2-iminobutanoate/2-iminopropanoate deaminase
MTNHTESKVFGPYEPARKAGDLYFVSGQVGVDPSTKSAEESVLAQTHQALHNMAAVLGGVGLHMGDVVKTTVYLTDMADFDQMNAAYVQHFGSPRPARAAIAVKELPRVGGAVTCRIEIEAVAMKGGE